MRAALHSAPVAIQRILRQFFEVELCGYCRWDAVIIDRDEENLVEVSFSVGNGRYRIAVNPPGDDPPYPLGRVVLTGAGPVMAGPLDQTTWEHAAKQIKTHAPTAPEVMEWE